MILHYDEFLEEQNENILPKFKTKLGRFIEYNKFLHEFTKEDFKNTLQNKNKYDFIYGVKYCVSVYLSWLKQRDASIVINAQTIIDNFNASDYCNPYDLMFYTAEELLLVCSSVFDKAKIHAAKQGVKISITQFYTLRATLILLWYGIPLDDIIKIKIRDVTIDCESRIFSYRIGNIINSISIDKNSIGILDYYLKSDGIIVDCHGVEKLKLYTQNTFLRTIGKSEMTSKVVSNALTRIPKEIDERDRLKPKNVYLSGLYNRLYNWEQVNGNIIKEKEEELKEQFKISNIHYLLREYKPYSEYRKNLK